MGELKIVGGKELSGTIEPSGSKNACLPLIAAAVLTRSRLALTDVPDITDVRAMLDIAGLLNARPQWNRRRLSFDFGLYRPISLLDEKVSRLRASYYFIPVLANDLDDFEILLPGGCSFAPRPIDLHLKVFEAFGLHSSTEGKKVRFIRNKLHGATFEFPYKSVGASINAILIAAACGEVSTLIGLSDEPEVKITIEFLKRNGIDMTLIGDTLVVGSSHTDVSGGEFRVPPDRIEAGTYLLLGALCATELKVLRAPRAELGSLFAVFDELGIAYEHDMEGTTVRRSKPSRPLVLRAGPYPLFPTDLVPPLVAYLGAFETLARLTDTIYPERYSYIDELRRLGYTLDFQAGSIVVFPRQRQARGCGLVARDLRGGAALVLAALNTPGTSVISGVEHLERGYARLAGKLMKIGASIDAQ